MPIRFIKRFIAKGRRNILSAKVANTLVDAINSLLRMREGKGIKITHADSGPVIELSDALQERLAMKGDGEGGEGMKDGQAEGALRWRGEWDNEKLFKKNDITIYRSASAIAAGDKAGTYIALVDNDDSKPFEAPAANQTTWRTLGKGAWERLVLGGEPGSGEGSVDINIDDMLGKDLTVRELDYCDGGVLKKVMVVASAPYTPAAP